MALNKVQPGDLITAQLMNELIDKVLDLEAKIANVAAVANGPPSALRLTYEGQLHPGDWAVLLGQSLLGTQRTLTVRLDGAYVQDYDGQLFTDTAVRLRIPALTLATSPQDVTMTVSTDRGEGKLTVPIHKLPTPLLRSMISISDPQITPATLVAGGAATFRYKIGILENRSVTFQLSATLERDNAQPLTLTVQDGAGSTLDGGRLSLGPFGQADLVVQIAAGQIQAAPFRVVVHVAAPDLEPFTWSKTIDQLGAQAQTDPNILFGTTSGTYKTSAGPGQTALDATAFTETADALEVHVPAAFGGVVNTTLVLFAPTQPPPASVTYEWKLTAKSGSTSTLVLSAKTPSVTLQKADFVFDAGLQKFKYSHPLPLAFTAGSGTATWLLEVSQSGQTAKTSKTIKLVAP